MIYAQIHSPRDSEFDILHPAGQDSAACVSIKSDHGTVDIFSRDPVKLHALADVVSRAAFALTSAQSKDCTAFKV